MRRKLNDSLTFARESNFDYCLVIDRQNSNGKKIQVLTSSGAEVIISSIDEIVDILEGGGSL